MAKGPLDKKKQQFFNPSRIDLGGDFSGVLPPAYRGGEGPPPEGEVDLSYMETPSAPPISPTPFPDSLVGPPSYDFMKGFLPPGQDPVSLPVAPEESLQTLRVAGEAIGAGAAPITQIAKGLFEKPGIIDAAAGITSSIAESIQDSKEKRDEENMEKARGLLGEIAFTQVSSESDFEKAVAKFHEKYGSVAVSDGAKKYRLSDLRDPWKAPDDQLAFVASMFIQDSIFPSDTNELNKIGRRFSFPNHPANEAIVQSKAEMQAILNNYPEYKDKALKHLWKRINSRWNDLQQPPPQESIEAARVQGAKRAEELKELQPFVRILGEEFAKEEQNRRTLLKEVNAGAADKVASAWTGFTFLEEEALPEVPIGFEERGANLDIINKEIEKRAPSEDRLLDPKMIQLEAVSPEPYEPTDPSVTVTIREPTPGSALAELFLGDEGVTYSKERTVPVAELTDSQLEELQGRLTKEQLKALQKPLVESVVDSTGRTILSVSPPKSVTPEEFGLISAQTLPPERWVLPLLAAVYSEDREGFDERWKKVTQAYSELYKDPGNVDAQTSIAAIIHEAITYPRGYTVKESGDYIELGPEAYAEKIKGVFRFYVPMPISWFRQNGEPWVFEHRGKKIPIYPVGDDVYDRLVDSVQGGEPQALEYVVALNTEEKDFLLERQQNFLKQLLLSSGLYGDRATYGWFGEMLGYNSITSSARWDQILQKGYPVDKGNITPTQLMMWYKNNDVDVGQSAILHASYMRELALKMAGGGDSSALLYRIPKAWLTSIGDLGATTAHGVAAAFTETPKWALETGFEFITAGGPLGYGLAKATEAAGIEGPMVKALQGQAEEYENQLAKPFELGKQLYASTVLYFADYMEPSVRKRRLMMDLPWVVSDALMVWGLVAGGARLAGKTASFLGRTGQAKITTLSKKLNPMKYDLDPQRVVQKPTFEAIDVPRPPLTFEEGVRGKQIHFDHLRQPGTPTPPGHGFFSEVAYIGDEIDELAKAYTPEAIVKKVRGVTRELAKRGDAVGRLASRVVIGGDWGEGPIRIQVENYSSRPTQLLIQSADMTTEALNSIVKHMNVDGVGGRAQVAHALRELTRELGQLSLQGDLAGKILYEFTYHPKAAKPRFKIRESVADEGLTYIVEDLSTKEVVGEYATPSQARASMEEGSFVDSTNTSVSAIDDAAPYGIPDGIELEMLPGEEVKGWQLVDKATGERVLASKSMEEIQKFRKDKGETLLPNKEQKYQVVEAVFLDDPSDSAHRIVDRHGRLMETFPNREAAYARLRELGVSSPQKFKITGEELARALNSPEALELVSQALISAAKRENLNLLRNPDFPDRGVLGITVPVKDIDGNVHQLDAVKLGLLRPRGKTYELSPMARMIINDSNVGAAGYESRMRSSIGGFEEIRFVSEFAEEGPIIAVDHISLAKVNRPLVIESSPSPKPYLEVQAPVPPRTEAVRKTKIDLPETETSWGVEKEVEVDLPATERSWEIEKTVTDVADAGYWKYIRDKADIQRKLKPMSSEKTVAEVASIDFDEGVKLLGTKLDVDEAYTSILEPQASALVRRLGTRDLQKIADHYSEQLGVPIEIKKSLPTGADKLQVEIRPPLRKQVPPGRQPSSLDAWQIVVPFEPRLKVVGRVKGKDRLVQYAPGRTEILPADKRPTKTGPKVELTPALRKKTKEFQEKIRAKLLVKRNKLSEELAVVEARPIRPRKKVKGKWVDKTKKQVDAAFNRKLKKENALREQIAEVESGIKETQRIIDLAKPGFLEAAVQMKGRRKFYMPEGNFDVSVVRQSIEQIAEHLRGGGSRATLRIPFAVKDDVLYLANQPKTQQRSLVRDSAIADTIKGTPENKTKILREADIGGRAPFLPAKFSRRTYVYKPQPWETGDFIDFREKPTTATVVTQPKQPKKKRQTQAELPLTEESWSLEYAPPKIVRPKPPEYLQLFEEWVDRKVADAPKKSKKRTPQQWLDAYKAVVSKALKDGSYEKALKPNKMGVALADRDLVGQIILSADLKIPDNMKSFYVGANPSGGPKLYNLNKMQVKQVVGRTQTFEKPILKPEGLETGFEGRAAYGGKFPREAVTLDWIANELGYNVKTGVAVFDFVTANDGTLIRRPAAVDKLVANVMGRRVRFETKSVKTEAMSANGHDVIPNQLERDSGFGRGVSMLMDENGMPITNDEWKAKYTEYSNKNVTRTDSQLVAQYLNRIDYFDVRDTSLGKMFFEYGAEALEPMAELAGKTLLTDSIANRLPSLNPRNWVNGQWKAMHRNPIAQVKAAFNSLSGESLAAWDVWRRGTGEVPQLAQVYSWGNDWVEAGLVKPVTDASGAVVSYQPTSLGILAAVYGIGRRSDFYRNMPFRQLTGTGAQGLAPNLRIDFRRVIDEITPVTAEDLQVKHILHSLNDLERSRKWISDPIIAYQNAVLRYAADAGMFPTANATLNAIGYFRNIWEGAFDEYSRVSSGSKPFSESADKARTTKGYTEAEVSSMELLAGKSMVHMDPHMFLGFVQAELETRVNFINIIERLIDEGIVRPESEHVALLKVKDGKLKTAGEEKTGPGLGFKPIDMDDLLGKMKNRTVEVDVPEGSERILFEGLKNKYGQLYATPQAVELLNLQLSTKAHLDKVSKKYAHESNVVKDLFFDVDENLRSKEDVLRKAHELMGPEIEPIIRDAYTEMAVKAGKAVNPNISVRKMLSLIAGTDRESSVLASVIDKMAGASHVVQGLALQRWYKTGALFRSSARGFMRNTFGNFALALAHHPEAFLDPVYWEGMRYFWGGKLPAKEGIRVIPEGVGGIGPRRVTEKITLKNGDVVEAEVFRDSPLPPDVKEFQYELIARNIIGNGFSQELKADVPSLMRNMLGNNKTRAYREIMAETSLAIEKKIAKQKLGEAEGAGEAAKFLGDLLENYTMSAEFRKIVDDAVKAEGAEAVSKYLNSNWAKKAAEAGKYTVDFPFRTGPGKTLERHIKSLFVVTDDMYRWSHAYWLWKRKKMSFDDITVMSGEFMPDFVRNSPIMHATRLLNPWAFWPVKTARNLMLLASKRPVYTGLMRQLSLWLDAVEMSEMTPEDRWAHMLRPKREKSWMLRTPFGDYSFGYSFYTGDLDTLFDPMAALDVGVSGMVWDGLKFAKGALGPEFERIAYPEKFERRFGKDVVMAGFLDNLAFMYNHYHNTYMGRFTANPVNVAANVAKEFTSDGLYHELKEHIWDPEISMVDQLKRMAKFTTSVGLRASGSGLQRLRRVLGDPVNPDNIRIKSKLEDGFFLKKAMGSKDPETWADLIMAEMLGFDPASRNQAKQILADIIRKKKNVSAALRYVREGKGPEFEVDDGMPEGARLRYLKEAMDSPFGLSGKPIQETNVRDEEVMKRIMPALISTIQTEPSTKEPILRSLSELRKKSPSPFLDNMITIITGMDIQGIPTRKE